MEVMCGFLSMYLFPCLVLICMCSAAQSCPAQSCPPFPLGDSMDCVACLVPVSVGFPGNNTGAGCYFLLQGIFLTQGSNLCLFESPVLAGGFFITALPGKPLICILLL